MEVNQILPNMAAGDAISNHALELKRMLKSLGYSSEIYSLYREGLVSQHCRPIKEFKPKKDHLTLYHYSIGCRKVSNIFLQSEGRKVLVYHNITPHSYFEKYNKGIANILREGRETLPEFKDGVELAVGDSQYNVEELYSLGYR